MIKYSGKGNVVYLSQYPLEQAYIALLEEHENKQKEGNDEDGTRTCDSTHKHRKDNS